MTIEATGSLEVMLRLIDELARGHGRLSAVSDTFSDPDDPKGLRRTVLTAIVRATTPPTVPQIGRSLGYPRQTIQRQVDGLVEDGLARAIENPDHKTAQRLTATEAGRAVYERSASRSRAWAAAFAERFGRDRIETTVATLHDIRLALEADARQRGSAPDVAEGDS